jgi:uncharacterized repeat protein (TIGR01451 family)
MSAVWRTRPYRWLAILVALVLVGAGVTSAAAADPPKLLVSIKPNVTPVLAGDEMSWTISFSCSSSDVTVPCQGAKIVIPIPVSAPNGIAPIAKSVTTDTGALYVRDAQFTPAVNPTQAVWNLQPSVTGGASGQVVMVLQSKNLQTPNGETYTPVATATGTNLVTTTSNTNATITVNATSALAIVKTRMPSDTAPEPFPGDNVTYRIAASNSYTGPTSTPAGTESVQNMIVTDQLPPTAIFVSASRLDVERNAVVDCTVSGQDPTTGQGGLVTCPAINDPLGTGTNRRGQVVYVTVRYPVDQLAKNTPTNQADDGVTNTATVHAQPYLRPSVDLVATDDTIHGFRPRSSGSPGVRVAKSNNSQGSVTQGQSAVFWTNQAYNSGTTPLSVHWTDRLPCGYTSPTSAPVPCVDQTNTIDTIGVDWSYREPTNPVTATVTYLDGTTEVHTWSGVQTMLNRNWTLPKKAMDVTWDFTLAPGEVNNITYNTSLSADIAVPNPSPATTPYVTNVSKTDGNTYLENCLSDGWYSTDSGVTRTPIGWTDTVGSRCSTKQVLPAAPLCTTNCGKYSSNQTQAPGGLVDFRLTIQNTGTAPMHPQLLDLLPPQLKVQPGSVVFPPDASFKEPNSPRGSLAKVEIIDNYNDTGRQLLRITWPDTQVLRTSNEGVGTYSVTFKAIVQGGYPAGGYTNTVVYGDSKVNDICSTTARTLDVNDLDGDGSKTDYQCKASANFTIAELGGVSIDKAVKGESDASFMAPPSVGHTSPNGTGQWRVNIVNSGSVNLTSGVAYDILPFVGDTTSGTASGTRGSEWRNYFAGIESKPDTVTVEYSTSTNPCRGEVIAMGGTTASGPAGCDNTWLATPPTPLSTVRALRFVINDPTWVPGEAQTIIFNITAPSDATGISWNTASVAAKRDIGWLQPTESPKTGLVVPIDLELAKRVLSVDPHVVGGKVHYQLSLTNKGPGLATEVQVTDLLPAGLTFVSATPTQGTYAVATGLWDVGNLPDDQTVTLDVVATIANTAVTGLTNFTQVTRAHQLDIDSTPGNGVVNTVHEDDESQVPITLVTAAPSVHIVKSTNGFDANAEPGPLVATGGTVSWTYLVQNTGNIPLIDVNVSDDKQVTVTCPATRLEPSDGQPGGADEMTCTGTGTAIAGQYTNLGSVVATGADGDGNAVTPAGSVTDDDPSHYFGSQPGITIVKKINGDNAEAAPGVTTTHPGTMTTTFEVHNSGNVTLDPVTVTDSVYGKIACLKSALAADEAMTCTLVTATPAPGVQHHDVATVTGQPPTLADGTIPSVVTDSNGAYAHSTAAPDVSIKKYVNGVDANTAPFPEVVTGTTMNFTFVVTNTGNTALSSVTVTDPAFTSLNCRSDLLLRGEDMTCTATLPAPAPGVTHHNTATVTGTPATPAGTKIPGLDTVSDSDDANAVAVKAGLAIEKRINGADADATRGVAVLPGSTMQITFFVTNTGSMPLDPVTVTDDTITDPKDITCRKTALSVGESMTCTATLPAPANGVQHTNTATATGQPILNGKPSGDPLTPTDPANAWTAEPGIVIVKKINGQEASNSPGVAVKRLSSMDVTFEVRNTGNTVLTGVTVSDSVIPADKISCPRSTLTPAEPTMTCTAAYPAPEPGVQHTNTATVEGTPAQDDGTPITGAKKVNDTDTAYAYVVASPGVTIVKKINGDDAQVAPGVQVDPLAPMTVTFEITNTGNTPLNPVTVTDDVIPADKIFCPSTSLGVGAPTMTCTAQWPAPSAASAGHHQNTGKVTAVPSTLAGTSLGLKPLIETNVAHAWAALPSISVVKKINSDDANVAPGVQVAANASLAVTFEVTNTGNLRLSPVTLTDTEPDGPRVITCLKTALEPLESMTCEVTLTGPAAGAVHYDLATVVGTPIDPVTGQRAVNIATHQPMDDVTWTDPAYAFAPATASVNIVKSINGNDANVAPGVEVQPGSSMAITFVVTNTGGVPLASVTVTDSDPRAVVSCLEKTLLPNETMTCTATLPAPAAGSTHTDTATVVGTPVTADGTPAVGADGKPLGEVSNKDSAHAFAQVVTPVDPPSDDDPEHPEHSDSPRQPDGANPSPKGGLAVTGANVGAPLLLSLVLLCAGGVLWFASRGRRAKREE